MPEDMTKAFENRWRIYGLDDTAEDSERVKKLCRDFFEAGIRLAEPSVEPEALVTDSDFETWWNLYQKKRGKEKCMKKWSKLSASEKQACISATPAYVASTPDKVYRKDPLTYLNGKCWNDELIYHNNGTDKQQQRNQRLAEVAQRIADYPVDAQ